MLLTGVRMRGGLRILRRGRMVNLPLDVVDRPPQIAHNAAEPASELRHPLGTEEDKHQQYYEQDLRTAYSPKHAVPPLGWALDACPPAISG